jgi:Ca-activated chloride channel family protein
METIGFGQPLYLWLLAAPAVLLGLWLWRLVRHGRDRRSFHRHRRLPVREHLPLFGGLLFWLCLIGALASTIVATARPTAAVPLVRSAGVDVIILQDGSASMHVRDVGANRWQRSMQFLRTLGESLRWKDDRIALALFAHVAEPQIRLTKDPNTYFFFLDHLYDESPFRLEDDPTWDTNIEQGVFWGMRLIEKDEELHGRSPNAKVFVLISDGQAWSGEVARAMQLARNRDVPIFVVGVGTSSGGLIPEPPRRDPQSVTSGQPPALRPRPIHSSLDRASLADIATAGGGQYLELGRQSDRDIANRIISTTRRRAGSIGIESTGQDLYWQCLLLAAGLLVVGVVFMQEQTELWLYTLGAGAALFVVWTLTR